MKIAALSLLTLCLSATVVTPALANQDRVMPFARRTGDFVYGAVQGDEKRDTIRIVTTDWCALNQQEYFGVSDLDFTDVACQADEQRAVIARRRIPNAGLGLLAGQHHAQRIFQEHAPGHGQPHATPVAVEGVSSFSVQ